VEPIRLERTRTFDPQFQSFLQLPLLITLEEDWEIYRDVQGLEVPQILGDYCQIVCSSRRSNDNITKPRVLAFPFGFILHRSGNASDNSVHRQDAIIKRAGNKIQPERKPFRPFKTTTAMQ
jgi:hypothetical protein